MLFFLSTLYFWRSPSAVFAIWKGYTRKQKYYRNHWASLQSHLHHSYRIPTQGSPQLFWNQTTSHRRQGTQTNKQQYSQKHHFLSPLEYGGFTPHCLTALTFPVLCHQKLIGSAGSICDSTWPAFPRQKDGSNIRVWKHIPASSSCHPGGTLQLNLHCLNPRGSLQKPLLQSPEILGNSSKMNFSTLDRTRTSKIMKSAHPPWKCYDWTWPVRTHLRACLFLVLTNPLWIAAVIPPYALYFGNSCLLPQLWEKSGPPAPDPPPVCRISSCPSCNWKGSAQAPTKLSSSFPSKTKPVAVGARGSCISPLFRSSSPPPHPNLQEKI